MKLLWIACYDRIIWLHTPCVLLPLVSRVDGKDFRMTLPGRTMVPSLRWYGLSMEKIPMMPSAEFLTKRLVCLSHLHPQHPCLGFINWLVIKFRFLPPPPPPPFLHSGFQLVVLSRRIDWNPGVRIFCKGIH